MTVITERIIYHCVVCDVCLVKIIACIGGSVFNAWEAVREKGWAHERIDDKMRDVCPECQAKGDE